MAKDEHFWLNVCYVTAGLLFTFVGYKAIYTLGVQTGWLERYDSWFPVVNTIGGIALGVLALWVAAGDAERKEYYLSALAELKKVNWPSYDDTKRMTTVVVIVCAIFALILSVFDLIWVWALKFVLA